jgi:hypothetical protein
VVWRLGSATDMLPLNGMAAADCSLERASESLSGGRLGDEEEAGTRIRDAAIPSSWSVDAWLAGDPPPVFGLEARRGGD